MKRVTVLGSGTSMGVPMAGCDCRVCQSEDPKDNRLRTSIFLEWNDQHILVDTSADFRQQMINHQVRHIDAVIYTHHHVDHILGMDDLRSFNILNKSIIPIFLDQVTFKNLKRTFAYVFPEVPNPKILPRLDVHLIDNQPFQIGATNIIPIPLIHGKMPILGFRFGNFAYCTDVSAIPDSSFELLQNLDVLILDALRYTAHPTHFSLEEAVEAALKIGAKQTYFTHISHGIMHREGEERLPDGMGLAYDGLSFELSH